MTLDQFIELNKSKGLHWFDKDTIRFFSSRIASWDYNTGFFITSEKGPGDSPRRYTIRKANFKTGNVETVGDFQAYETAAKARTALKAIKRTFYP